MSRSAAPSGNIRIRDGEGVTARRLIVKMLIGFLRIRARCGIWWIWMNES